MIPGKNSPLSRLSQGNHTSTRTCARVRLGELFSPCDTRDGAGVLRQMFTPMIGVLANHREAICPVASRNPSPLMSISRFGDVASFTSDIRRGNNHTEATDPRAVFRTGDLRD